MTTGSTPAAELDSLLDGSPWSLAQKMVLVLVTLAMVLDGFDNAVLALAIPSIAKEWGVPRSAFGMVLALGLVGLCLGALAGRVADRFGRKTVLVGSVLMFGAGTLGAAWAQGLVELAVLRFFAGLGMGAAAPVATTLIAEITPPGRRGFAIAVTAVGISGGGILGAGIAAYALPEWGWRSLFLMAGLLTIPMLPLLVFLTPESPRFQLQRGLPSERIAGTLRRLGLTMPQAGLAPLPEVRARVGFASVLTPGLWRDSVAMWAIFFAGLSGGYMLTNWMPSTLAAAGMGPAATSLGLQAYTIGSVAGAVIVSILTARFGSRLMVGLAGVGLLVSLGLAFGIGRLEAAPLFLLIAIQGAGMASLLTTAFAIAAHVYPQAIRATGTGVALGLGRIGAVLSAPVGGMTVNSANGGVAFFGIAAAMFVVAAVGFLALRSHIPAARR